MKILAFVASAALAVTFATAAQAMPAAPAQAPASPLVTQVAGGCGPGWHRGPYGGCRRNGMMCRPVMRRACPPGWHLGPYGRRCVRNRW